MSAGESVEQLLHRVEPGRYDVYEELLRALAGGRVWMMLWHGRAGSPDVQYGSMDVAGHGYAPCATSERELAASGWTHGYEAVGGREIASVLFPGRWGLWLNPHAPGGGVGVPWLDLRRIAGGLDRLPAGPLRIGEPALDVPHFYAQLCLNAHRTPAVRALRRAWVQPALGAPYLAIGVDLYDAGPQAVESARSAVRQAAGALPEGLALCAVVMSDDHDPVAMWLRANSRPFFDRDVRGGVPAAAPGSGYGHPPH